MDMNMFYGILIPFVGYIGGCSLRLFYEKGSERSGCRGA